MQCIVLILKEGTDYNSLYLRENLKLRLYVHAGKDDKRKLSNLSFFLIECWVRSS